MPEFNPVAGLPEIAKSDIRPGDEVIWTWKGEQLNNAKFFCQTIIPLLDGKTEWEIKKQTDEFNLIVERDRTFYLIKRHSEEDTV